MLDLLCEDSLRREKDVFCHALLSNFVFECLLELIVLHEIIVLLKVEDDFVQVHEVAHLSDEALVTLAQKAAEVISLFDVYVRGV